MKSDTLHSKNIYFSRTATYIDSDAAFADAHVTWDSISEAQHQHEHEMMMKTIKELEEEDLKNQNHEGNSRVQIRL